MGLNKKIREALHPVIYAFSVIPSILLSPFVLLLSPTLLSASIFLVVYNIYCLGNIICYNHRNHDH